MIQNQNQNREEEQVPLVEQFKQQMLKAWQPVPTLTKTIIMFTVLAAIFLGLGIPMIVLSSGIIQNRVRYDDKCEIGDQNCIVKFEVPQEMLGPVYVYYELNNYYQNHRLYAKSLSDPQLKGNTISKSEAETECDPIVTNQDAGVTVSITGQVLNPSDVANPCGMIAYSLFNDSFSLGTSVTIEQTGIAWPSDLKKYQMPDPSVMWTDITNERFMNWMRIAAMPDFRKLWGRIQGNLAPGVYNLQIVNNYDISKFKGKKFFVVSQSNFFGSKNTFLSVTYIVVGGICLIIAILFLIKKLSKKRKTN